MIPPASILRTLRLASRPFPAAPAAKLSFFRNESEQSRVAIISILKPRCKMIHGIHGFTHQIFRVAGWPLDCLSIWGLNRERILAPLNCRANSGLSRPASRRCEHITACTRRERSTPYPNHCPQHEGHRFLVRILRHYRNRRTNGSRRQVIGSAGHRRVPRPIGRISGSRSARRRRATGLRGKSEPEHRVLTSPLTTRSAVAAWRNSDNVHRS